MSLLILRIITVFYWIRKTILSHLQTVKTSSLQTRWSFLVIIRDDIFFVFLLQNRLLYFRWNPLQNGIPVRSMKYVLMQKMYITKTYLYNFNPLKPHFYIVKLEFTGVFIIFLISAQKHRLWVLVELPHRGGSNEYPQSMFWAEIWKISEFLSGKFHCLVVNFLLYLNRRVFIMNDWPLITPFIWHYMYELILEGYKFHMHIQIL